MKLYHLTPMENARSILKNGLIIGKKSYANIDVDNSNRIYLTTSIEKLLMQEGEWKNKIAIFEVNVLKILGYEMNVDWELNYCNDESPFSFYITENIPSSNIKLIGSIDNGNINMI